VAPRVGLDALEKRKIPYPCQEPKRNSSVSQHMTFSTELPWLPGDRGCSTELAAVFNFRVTPFGNGEY